jgi:hypothetical protein
MERIYYEKRAYLHINQDEDLPLCNKNRISEELEPGSYLSQFMFSYPTFKCRFY